MRHRVNLSLVVLGILAVVVGSAAQEKKSSDEGWISLFNGKDLSGWRVWDRNAINSWSVQDGVMANIRPPKDRGTDLLTEQLFGDCELHIEFKVPERSNSGVFLQGRYEIQVMDSYGRPPSVGGCGALYNQVAPLVNASKPAGEWQSFDVIFHQPRINASGRVTKRARMTVYHNGQRIIDNAELKGQTGGPMRRGEKTPGPLLLQGDHGTVWYRNVRIRPLD